MLELYLHQANTEKGPEDSKNVTVTLLEFILRDWPQSLRAVFLSIFVPQAAVKRKQKSLSREHQDRFDKVHAPKFSSTSGPVKCSHRLDEKPLLNTTENEIKKGRPRKQFQLQLNINCFINRGVKF